MYVAVAAALAALVPPSLELRTPRSRSNDATAVATAVREAGRPGDGLLHLSGRQRILTATHPDDTRLLVDLALARDPVASNTLAGVEFAAPGIAARMKEFDRIVVVRAAGERASGDPREEAKEETLRRHFREDRAVEVNGARVSVQVRRHGDSARAEFLRAPSGSG